MSGKKQADENPKEHHREVGDVCPVFWFLMCLIVVGNKKTCTLWGLITGCLSWKRDELLPGIVHLESREASNKARISLNLAVHLKEPRREDSQFTKRIADPLSSLFPKRKVWIVFQSLKSFELFPGVVEKIQQCGALIDYLHVKSPSNTTTKSVFALWRSRFRLLRSLQKPLQPFIEFD